MQQLLYTPEGVRDILGNECVRKNVLESELKREMHLYGYQDIQTPTFEFLETFRKIAGNISVKELYKLFDRDGEILMLRSDIVPQIVRVAATELTEQEFPARFCYTGNVFDNRLGEKTLIGAELLGLTSVEADAEILALAIECLKCSGLEEFQIRLNNGVFLQSLLDDAAVEEKLEEQIRELIWGRNFTDLDKLMRATDVKSATRKAFSLLAELNGDLEVLTEAKRIAPNSVALNALRRLEEIYQVLCYYKVEKFVRFDLSFSEEKECCTGIQFCGYAKGFENVIVKGGRHDRLAKGFGKEIPAVGATIDIEALMKAQWIHQVAFVQDQNQTLILYDETRAKDAVRLAKDFRSKGKDTALLKKEENRTLESYIEYGKQNQMGSILYVQNSHQIQVINLVTNEQKVVKRGD